LVFLGRIGHFKGCAKKIKKCSARSTRLFVASRRRKDFASAFLAYVPRAHGVRSNNFKSITQICYYARIEELFRVGRGRVAGTGTQPREIERHAAYGMGEVRPRMALAVDFHVHNAPSRGAPRGRLVASEPASSPHQIAVGGKSLADCEDGWRERWRKPGAEKPRVRHAMYKNVAEKTNEEILKGIPYILSPRSLLLPPLYHLYPSYHTSLDSPQYIPAPSLHALGRLLGIKGA